ncbi:MAG: hypothetical protein ACQESR_25710, partial [Planctomycetota bacterium]
VGDDRLDKVASQHRRPSLAEIDGHVGRGCAAAFWGLPVRMPLVARRFDGGKRLIVGRPLFASLAFKDQQGPMLESLFSDKLPSSEEEGAGINKEGAGKTPQETGPRMTCRHSMKFLLEADR